MRIAFVQEVAKRPRAVAGDSLAGEQRAARAVVPYVPTLSAHEAGGLSNTSRYGPVHLGGLRDSELGLSAP